MHILQHLKSTHSSMILWKMYFRLQKMINFLPTKSLHRYIENNDSIWKMLMTFQEEVHAYDLQTACFLHCVLIVGKAKL